MVWGATDNYGMYMPRDGDGDVGSQWGEDKLNYNFDLIDGMIHDLVTDLNLHEDTTTGNPHRVTLQQVVNADPDTDIQALELEALTDGTSNVDYLHNHTYIAPHHHASHENGGYDELDISGLQGEAYELTQHKNSVTAHPAVSITFDDTIALLGENTVQDAIDVHVSDTGNPHQTTYVQVGALADMTSVIQAMHISLGAVTTSAIDTSAVETVKVADGAITHPKLADNSDSDLTKTSLGSLTRFSTLNLVSPTGVDVIVSGGLGCLDFGSTDTYWRVSVDNDTVFRSETDQTFGVQIEYQDSGLGDIQIGYYDQTSVEQVPITIATCENTGQWRRAYLGNLSGVFNGGYSGQSNADIKLSITSGSLILRRILVWLPNRRAHVDWVTEPVRTPFFNEIVSDSGWIGILPDSTSAFNHYLGVLPDVVDLIGSENSGGCDFHNKNLGGNTLELSVSGCWFEQVSETQLVVNRAVGDAVWSYFRVIPRVRI